MIPERIQFYLRTHDVPYFAHTHPRAVTAQEVAAALHVSGHRVAKSVLLEADDRIWMAVLPACAEVDVEKVATLLDARRVRLLTEPEFAGLFPECEVGAEPPLGSLYALPVVMDRELTEWPDIVIRAGSHEDAAELRLQDYEMLEWPRVGDLQAR